MPDPIPFDMAPLDRLTPDERALVRRAAEPMHFAAQAALLAPGAAPTHVHLIVSGRVEQAEGGEVVAVHEPGTLIGAREVLADRTGGHWAALGDVATQAIPKAVLQSLVAGNAGFGASLFGALAHGLAAATQRRPQRELLTLMAVRIRDAYLRPPFFVDGAMDIVSVCRLLAQQGLNNALVRDGERIGMFTTTDLRDALLRGVPPETIPVRAVAQFELIALPAHSELFDALLAMVRHRVHRVLVHDGDAIVGVLSQLDLMSFISNHSHIIALQIEQAASVAELQAAALQIDGLVDLLHRGGVRVDVIGALVSELNLRVFARLWAFVAPRDLVDNSCLVVMGSEGRGEQILKTDQDNALLLRDGFDFPGLDAVAQRFNAALADFGYPPCPGDIMLTNPLWRQPLAAFKGTLQHWLAGTDPQGAMHLAIFFDAVAVAGDAELLQQARRHLDASLADDDAFLARFAQAADQFAEPGAWWAWLAPRREEPPLDLKKLGTFPIVHGARALALQYRVRAPGTVQRLRALAGQHRLDADLARDLIDALHCLMGVRLNHQLRQRQRGEAPTNLVPPGALGTLERDTLKDALAIVKRFRQYLRLHFRLDAL